MPPEETWPNGFAGDALQRLLVPRSRFRARLTLGVRLHTQKESLMTNDILTQSPADSSLAQHLLVMAFGVAQTSVLCTAAQLGLADHVKDGPKSVAALAEATGTHPSTLTRLMGVLAHLGLFVETAPGQFTCTPLGALLQTDAPQSVRHFAMLMGGEWYGPTWPHLAQSVRTGTSAFESVFGMNVYSYLPQHPAALAVFQQTMSDLSADEGLAVRDAYDFARCHTVVDVGGVSSWVGIFWRQCRREATCISSSVFW